MTNIVKEFNLSYDPAKLPRELRPYYLSADEKDLAEMLEALNLKSPEELFSHIAKEYQFSNNLGLGPALGYEQNLSHLYRVSQKNNVVPSFIGDGLQSYRVGEMTPYVCSIRGLTTAYTPYQPERSQGTLHTLWMYSSCLSMLTGFEAINASFYDRATTLFEAFNTARRITGRNTILVTEGIYPGDKEVLITLAKETEMRLVFLALDKKTGSTSLSLAREKAIEIGDDLAGICLTQITHFGALENVHGLTDLATELSAQSIAIIDPMTLATGGLLRPIHFGSKGQGADMIVGEGQHLALGPNFGGPGLGIFGIRYNESNRNSIRQTAGRFVGKAKDEFGNDCLCMILSTREQHIRREKATSNICSNQSFLATLAGAGILERGEKGMSASCRLAQTNARILAQELIQFEGVELAFSGPFFNEFTLRVPRAKGLQLKAIEELEVGVDVTSRLPGENELLLKISLSDIQGEKELSLIKKNFSQIFSRSKTHIAIPEIAKEFKGQDTVGLPNFSLEELKSFYNKLGSLNLSPDDNIYPLGSCTMKYNPYINDWAASLNGFTSVHPQSPERNAQGSLEVLYTIQESFKDITGLPGVTTQPVAGAQGELVGLKLFQAYHRDRGNAEKKNVVLIPRSAHGTNPATATMAGYEVKKVDGKQVGIVTIEAGSDGQINFEELKRLVDQYKDSIAGVMVTNPNTAGIFETRFKEMADLIHAVDGLVYMDGANMNAIAGIVDLGKLGVDAVHNNLHKTWTVPHGGGGPGDAIVAVSQKLIDYLPGIQVKKVGETFSTFRAPKSIGSFHRHFGNFAHKVRTYAYLKALGDEGVRKMSQVSVLSANYLYDRLKKTFPTLPAQAQSAKRMHEFILTLSPETFKAIAESGTPKAQAIARVGKLFLDFGLHAPTVAFPEVYGLMIEPTESFSKSELDRFIDVVESIHRLIQSNPEVLKTVPHFTPVRKVDEVEANRNPIFSEKILALPKLPKDRVDPRELSKLATADICEKIYQAHIESEKQRPH